jgi:ubiquitin carboxyl-terminal hydrolase 4/11/15
MVPVLLTCWRCKDETYLSELNPDNPLGTGGVVARAYADLIKNLFAASSYIAYAPRRFKRSICSHAHQFAEYAQQDSQELLAFLLDGLHEDLNRISTKPYIPNPEWRGGGNKELLELAMRSWDAYKKRNDSVIVDLFQGQYKSAVICAECQHVSKALFRAPSYPPNSQSPYAKTSVIFDPFMYLTLPIPVQASWDQQVFYIPWNHTEPGLSVGT